MADLNRNLSETITISDSADTTGVLNRGLSETLTIAALLSKSETTASIYVGIPLGAILREKYELLIGADPKRSFDTTKRQYFIQRSGALADPSTPTTFYMHTTFDNLSLPEAHLDARERLMFIAESAATTDDGWEDAARIWGLT